jgi:hypothetical protein
VISIGNATSDYPLLKFSENSPNSLQLVVNHDDSIREYIYDYEKVKAMCQKNNWHEISMKNDFKVVFSE